MSDAPGDLRVAALEAFGNAYAKFSGFRVGAAVRDGSGRVFSGANVENSSFGLTRCAEQSAILALVSSGARDFTELVVVSDSTPPASPCGACRQILFEFGPDAAVWLVNLDGETIRTDVSSLLPLGFRLEASED